MKCAVLSDIHGNLHALRAVLADARARKPDVYFILGDYYGEFPFPNEALDALGRLRNAYFVRGNRETYLDTLRAQDPAGWTDEQFGALYWNYARLSGKSHRRIARMPDTLSMALAGQTFHLAHAPAAHFGPSVVDKTGGMRYAEDRAKGQVLPDGFSRHAQGLLAADAAFARTLAAMPGGVYLFGHYHTQWHHRKGGALLVNPGSVGMPLDLMSTASYTVLEWDGEAVRVDERRVAYDVESAVKALKGSSLYDAAPVWCNITIHEARTGESEAGNFLRFAARLAGERQDARRPHPNTLWNEAARLFEGGRFAGEGRG